MQPDKGMTALLATLRDACDAKAEQAARVAFDALDDAHGDDERLRGMFLDAYFVNDERHPLATRLACMRRMRDQCDAILVGSTHS